MFLHFLHIFTFFYKILLTFFLPSDNLEGNFLQMEEKYMKQLETARLIMRKFKKEDVDDEYEVVSDEKVAQYSDFKAYTTKEDTLISIESAIQEYDTYEACWAIEEKASHKVIGHIRITNASLKNRQCTLLWALGQKYWGLGYSEEILKVMLKYLFEEHPFDIIVVKYYSDSAFLNPILESAGMKRDAILRDRRINDITGKKDALIIYSILKEEMNW